MEERERRRLAQKRKLLWKRAVEIEEFVRGSLVLMKRRCIFAGCRKCASGERHPTWVLTVHEKGKTRTVYVGKSRLAEAKRLVENYRRLRGLVEQVAQINLLLFRGGDLFRTRTQRRRLHARRSGHDLDGMTRTARIGVMSRTKTPRVQPLKVGAPRKRHM